MSQIKKEKLKIAKFHQVFQKSMTYPNSMVWSQVVDFNFTQWEEIEPSITKVINFIDTYRYNNEFQDYGEYRKKIEIYAVACLPFLIFEGRLDDPRTEDRELRRKTLEWLQFIKQNKGYTRHLIHSMTTDDSITNIQDDRLDKEIAIMKWFVDNATITKKKKNWSGVLQFLYLADTIDKLWSSSELKKKKDFLYQLFSIFDEDMKNEITPDVIEMQMIIKARKCSLINVSEEHISKVLSQPNNKLTEVEIRNHFHIDLSESLI